MSLLPNFTVTQTPGSPSIVSLTDTSTGSDVAITGRRVYLATGLGTFLVPTGTSTQYILWALASSSININALDKDYGLLITVEWYNVSGTTLYSKAANYGLTGYNEDEDYSLTQICASNPLIINDNKFFEYKSALRNAIDSGNQSISRANDIYNAQLCYDIGTQLRVNSQYTFNVNS